MADRWIVTTREFRKHKTLALAVAEAERLRGISGKDFSVLRIKTTLEPTRLFDKMADTLESARAVMRSVRNNLAKGGDTANSLILNDEIHRINDVLNKIEEDAA